MLHISRYAVHLSEGFAEAFAADVPACDGETRRIRGPSTVPSFGHERYRKEQRSAAGEVRCRDTRTSERHARVVELEQRVKEPVDGSILLSDSRCRHREHREVPTPARRQVPGGPYLLGRLGGDGDVELRGGRKPAVQTSKSRMIVDECRISPEVVLDALIYSIKAIRDRERCEIYSYLRPLRWRRLTEPWECER